MPAHEPRMIEHDFMLYSDVYRPIADIKSADRELDAIFKQ